GRHRAERTASRHDFGACCRKISCGIHLHNAAPRRAAMLHARDDLLTNIAALSEGDAAKLIHVGVMREGVAISKIDGSLGYAEGDSVSVVMTRAGGCVARRGNRRAGCDDAAKAEFPNARI